MSKQCSCGKQIDFVTVGSKTVPVDTTAPVYAVTLTADGELEGQHVNGGRAEPNLFVPVYRVGHFSTCPDAGAYSQSKSARLEVLVELVGSVNDLLGVQGDDPNRATVMRDAVTRMRAAREALGGVT